tara:strand:+ start:359 stop:568 length:210 start_codon:yes stop_codon:yes gene_type:complete
MTAILDKFLGKWASRKLLVFGLATILIFLGKIDSNDWTYIAIAYVVVQGLVDAKTIIKNFKSESQNAKF